MSTDGAADAADADEFGDMGDAAAPTDADEIADNGAADPADADEIADNGAAAPADADEIADNGDDAANLNDGDVPSLPLHSIAISLLMTTRIWHWWQVDCTFSYTTE